MTQSSKNFYLEDIEFVKHLCDIIASREEGDGFTDEALRFYLYRLGVTVYRRYHQVGEPASISQPGLQAPTKKWSMKTRSYVDERELEVV